MSRSFLRAASLFGRENLSRSHHALTLSRSATFQPHLLSTKPSLPRTFASVPPICAKVGRIPVKQIPISAVRGGSTPLAYNTSDLPTPHTRLKPTLWRPLLFCSTLSVLAFSSAVYLTNEESARWRALLRDRTVGFFGKAEPTDLQLAHARRVGEAQEMKHWLGEFVPRPVAVMINWWFRLSEGKQTALALVVVNSAVFLAWQARNPSVRSHMVRHWMHYPLSGRSHTVLTSMFSHASFVHLSFNMLALWSFAPAVHEYLARRVRGSYDLTLPKIPEITSQYHFLAFFLTAGLVSGFASHAFSLLVRAPRLLKWRQGLLPPGPPPSPILPSLGISGAVYGCLTATALAFPDASISIIFLPTIPISIGPGILGVVTLDLLGLIRGWRVFDHAGHLGGAVVGALWYKYGGKAFDNARAVGWEETAAKAEGRRSSWR